MTSEIVESHVLNVKSMIKSRNLEEDIHLMPGDFIFVPQNTISKIKRFLPTSDMSLYSIRQNFRRHLTVVSVKGLNNGG